MNTPLISVIVPVFNVEKYLSRCVQSILHQTYTNLEILLIDDGSIDHSGEICDHFALQDNRVKVIHKKNGGLSDARNVGLTTASGSYISFIDSDDFIHKDMLHIMIDTSIHHQSDVVEVGYREVFNDQNALTDQISNTPNDVTSYETKNAVVNCLLNHHSIINVWNKLYKKELWDHIRFPVGKFYEDYFVTYKIINSVNKVVEINQEMYFYFQRKDSIMGSSFSLQKFENHFEANLKMMNYIADHHSELLPLASIRYYETAIVFLFDLLDKKKGIANYRVIASRARKELLNSRRYINNSTEFKKLCRTYLNDHFEEFMRRRKRVIRNLRLLKQSNWSFYVIKNLRAAFSKKT
ncbi:glycosyltransferase [Sporolactobacillus shoreicorticis]|uniref:Glycosyltransferase family 2 protein n=1 Tax=Sporolactobacillus shoreicorticis TaxID=1923877 RepID=A0ABW5S3X7_9BACL|nr:glycosyltransferase [Sporolactobacillus shoreicorticis]MCO7124213.1 glycosyltransferase [Sporolactobacillus shoreicorticis]